MSFGGRPVSPGKQTTSFLALYTVGGSFTTVLNLRIEARFNYVAFTSTQSVVLGFNVPSTVI